MKITVSIVLSLLTAAWLCGCEQPPQFPPLPEISNSASGNGAMVALALPKRSLKIGETVQATIIVRNTTDQPMRIDATTSAPYHIRVYRATSVGWEVTKQYPEAALMVMSPWTLEPQTQRTFSAKLPVEPDWPTGTVRVTAGINGLGDIHPGLTVMVTR